MLILCTSIWIYIIKKLATRHNLIAPKHQNPHHIFLQGKKTRNDYEARPVGWAEPLLVPKPEPLIQRAMGGVLVMVCTETSPPKAAGKGNHWLSS